MVSEARAWNGGRLYTWEGLSSSAGFRQGEGVFETLKTFKSKPVFLHRHVMRLLQGAELLGIRELPNSEAVELQVEETLKTDMTGDAQSERVIRFALFYDVDRWGFTVSTEPWNKKFGPSHGVGVWVGYSTYPHPGRYLIPPGGDVQVKWLSRGPLAHALRDAKYLGYDEALLLDANANVVEGTRSNIFAVVDNTVYSPGPKSGALPGVTREVVVDCARSMHLGVEDRVIPKTVLEKSDEIFLTSSLLGIAPVFKIANGSYLNDKIGTKTHSLMSELERRMRGS